MNEDKLTCGDFGGRAEWTGEPCKREAGWGTPLSDGLCRQHQEGPDEEKEFRAPEMMTDRQLEHYEFLIEQAEKIGVYQTAFSGLFVAAAVCWGQWLDLIERVQEDGFVQEDAYRDGDSKHPAATQMRNIRKEYVKYLGKIGFTPTDLQRVEMPDDDEVEKSDMEELLSG